MILLLLYLTTALLLALGIEAVGGFILRVLNYPNSVPRIFHWAVGAVLFTWVLIGLGIIGFYVPGAMWCLWFLLLLLSIPVFIREYRRFRSEAKGESQQASSILYGITQVLVLVLLIVCFFSVMTPETRYDPYDYHLTIPTLYLANQEISEIPWHVFAYMPKNGEILYGWALGIKDDSVAKMIHYGFGILCLVAVGTFMTRLVNREVGWFTLGLGLSLPVFTFVATSAYIDLIRAFWEIMGLYALYLTWEATERKYRVRYYFLAALFAGMAMGTKYVAWLIFFIPFTVLFLLTLRKFEPRQWKWLVPSVMVIGFSPLLPWLIYNVFWTGNPVYPLLPSIFGQHIPPAQEAYEFIRSHAPSWDHVFSFSVVTLISDRVYRLMLDGNALFVVGAVALVSSPWWIRRSIGVCLPRYAAVGLGIYLVISTLLFMVGVDNDDGRFFLSSLILFSIPAALALYVIRDSIYDLSFIHRILLSGVMVLFFINAISYRFGQLQDLNESAIPLLTKEQRDSFLLRHFPRYACIEWANKNLSSDAYVLGIGYPLRHRHISNLKYGYIPFLQEVDSDIRAEELVRKLKEGGITHIAEPFPSFLREIDWSMLQPDSLQPVFRHRRTTLYRLLDVEEMQ